MPKRDYTKAKPETMPSTFTTRLKIGRAEIDTAKITNGDYSRAITLGLAVMSALGEIDLRTIVAIGEETVPATKEG